MPNGSMNVNVHASGLKNVMCPWTQWGLSVVGAKDELERLMEKSISHVL